MKQITKNQSRRNPAPSPVSAKGFLLIFSLLFALTVTGCASKDNQESGLKPPQQETQANLTKRLDWVKSNPNMTPQQKQFVSNMIKSNSGIGRQSQTKDFGAPQSAAGGG